MHKLNNKTYFSVAEAAEIIGVSRVTVFLWIKKGTIQAQKIGRNYIIPHEEVSKHIEKRPINEEEKVEIKKTLDKAIKDYGDAIRMLGNE